MWQLKNDYILMKNKAIDNAKVGLFVLAGVLFMLLTLYMIGKNKNLLGSSFTLKAVVNDVNGLVPGNNVRFKGIDVGTVKSIEIDNDTAIHITMVIDQKIKTHIKKNAIATIGTDGLMGNKLVNINSLDGFSESVQEGEVLYSRNPIDTDEMLRTLNITNNNIEKITSNLYEITVKLNGSKSLWSLLSDTVITEELQKGISEFRKASSNTAELTRTTKELALNLERGEGMVNKLFTDTALVFQLVNSLHNIEKASDDAASTVSEINAMFSDIKEGEGTAGLLLSDSLLRQSLYNSALNLEEGTYRFNQNMEALKSNFLFRRYFKKIEKQQRAQLKTD